MDELIKRITDKVGIEAGLAEKSVGMILGFLQREADDGAVAKMIESLPGGPEAVAMHGAEDAGGGVMGLGQQLMGEGLGMSDITSVSRELMSFAKEKSDEETVDTVVNSVPGLSQFV